MNKIAIYGVILSFLAIMVGAYIQSGHLLLLFNPHALLIVLGGTVGAVMMQTPSSVFIRAMKRIKTVFKPEEIPFKHEINKIVRWSHLVRKDGFLILEELAYKEQQPILKKGLIAIAQGISIPSLRRILETEMEGVSYHEMQVAYVYESMGGYSPTIGIIGAVLGLMEVMRHLSNPSELGAGIAVAFIATLYGVAFANLLFIPIANNLKSQIDAHHYYQEMMLEGLMSLAEGEHPAVIEQKLHGYLVK